MRNGTKFILICCYALIAAPREEYKRAFQKSATLGVGKSLRIEHSLGSLNIRTHPGSELNIQATIRCSARAAAEARVCTDRIQISVDESSTGVSVRTVYPRNEGRSNLSFGADYDIVMPENAPLDVRNRFGSVSVANLQAASGINNANGRVTFSGGRGRQRIENSFGDVDVRGNDGEVTVRNTNGNVAASDISGAVDITNRFGATRVANAGRGLMIHSNNGNIEADNIGGISTITNSFGRVIVTEAKGDVTVDNQNGAVQATGITGAAHLNTSFDKINATRIGKGLTVHAQNSTVTADSVGESAVVETSFGNADLRRVKGGVRVTARNSPVRLVGIGGEVYAKTSFAGIDVSDAVGAITVENQNGHVMVETKSGQRCQPVSLSTSFGPIRVSIPPGTGYNVTARTSFGRVHSNHEITISGGISPDALTGKIAGGGCELRLMGQNGNIDIL